MLCKEHFADLALWHAHCHTEVMLELYVDIVIPTWLQFFCLTNSIGLSDNSDNFSWTLIAKPVCLHRWTSKTRTRFSGALAVGFLPFHLTSISSQLGSVPFIFPFRPSRVAGPDQSRSSPLTFLSSSFCALSHERFKGAEGCIHCYHSFLFLAFPNSAPVFYRYDV